MLVLMKNILLMLNIESRGRFSSEYRKRLQKLGEKENDI